MSGDIRVASYSGEF